MDPVIFLLAVMVGTIVLSPILGAESRPAFLRPDRKLVPPFAGSMRSEDWPPSEFDR